MYDTFKTSIVHKKMPMNEKRISTHTNSSDTNSSDTNSSETNSSVEQRQREGKVVAEKKEYVWP